MPDRREFLRLLALGVLGAACTSTSAPPVTAGDATPTGVGTGPSPSTTGAPTQTRAPTATTAWMRLATDGPGARREHTLSAAGDTAYLFGGRDGSDVLGDLWRFDRGSGWERIDAPGAPSPRFGHNAVVINEQLLVVFGGQRGGDLYDDTYAFDLERERWSPVEPRGGGPGIRYGAGAIEWRDWFYISHGFQFGSRYDDTQRLAVIETGRWQDRTPSGSVPVKRCLHRCAPLDTANRDHMLLFGGQTDGQPYLGDTWLFDLQREGWDRVTGRSPAARNLYALVGRGADAFLFGGFGPDGPLRDVWRFDGEDWSRLSLTGEGPTARGGIEGTLFGGNAMLIFGGDDGSRRLGDTWVLDDLPA